MSMNPQRTALVVLLLGAAGLVAGPAARADWLVTRDGARVETKGPWKVQGRTIVFTLPNGTLSSLRADEVDLDQSALATAKAKEPVPAKAPEKKAPVLVLTDKDHPPVLGAGIGDAQPGGDKKPAAAASSSDVTVAAWDQTMQPNDAGVELFGTLKNSGVNMVSQVSLGIDVLDTNGDPLATVEAQVSDTALAPGQSTSFRASIPGLLHVDGVRFNVQSTSFRPQEPGTEEQPEGQPAAPPESGSGPQ